MGRFRSPPRVELVQVERDALVSEEVVYSGHEFNARPPADVVGFRLPAGVAVEETEW